MLDEKQLYDLVHGIGGSDAAAIVGCDPYRQAMDVYLVKTGEIEPNQNLEQENEAVLWGNRLEGVIAEEWSRRAGQAIVTRADAFVHPEHSFIIGHVDGLVEGKKEGLEVKARGAFAAEEYGPSGGDQVKESDILQCQHYMACTGYGMWNMAVLIGGQELRSYKIPRDESLLSNLIELEYRFWSAVERRVPPDLDFSHRSTPSLINRFFPGTDGKTVLLPDRAVEIHELMTTAAEERKNADSRYKALKNERDSLLGNTAVGVLPDGSGGWSRKRVDVKARAAGAYSFTGVYFSKKHKRVDP